jgi:hypothetical protein
MNNCAFTIVAKNYIGLGLILKKSFCEYHKDIDFFIFVADEMEQGVETVPQEVVFAKSVLPFSEDTWKDMTFKYDLTEFCTAIKPGCFKYLLESGYEKAIYFDPDIYIFSSVNEVYQRLDSYDIALTPQIAGIHVNYTGEHPEWVMNVNGIFNLGFCAIRNSSTSQLLLNWWQQRLLDNCFNDRSVGNFTDQKWMDWMPGFLGNDHLYVFRNLGMNMAPWNYFERELFYKDGHIMVRFRTQDCPQQEDKLVFLHFAGYDYTLMKQGIIKRKRIQDLKEYEDLSIATNIYQKAIVSNQVLFDSFISQSYSYATFDNGEVITSFHRRLYHGTKLANYPYSDPFTTGKGTFYEAIRKKGMIIDSSYDKINQYNIKNMDGKKKAVGLLFGALFRLMGYRRYVLFVKSLYHFCRPELHLFLIKKYIGKKT